MIEITYKKLKETLQEEDFYAIMIEHECVMWRLSEAKHIIVGPEIFLDVEINREV